MAKRSAAAAQLLFLLIVAGAAVIRSVEGCGDDGIRCNDDECCSSFDGMCGKGPEFCNVAIGLCTCKGGYCDVLCPRPPVPPKKKKCFPGHATVQLEGGKSKTMEKLALGDRVAVWSADTGRVAYDEIYAFGHKDALVVSPMVKIDMHMAGEASPASLELSAGHFVPTKQEGSVLYKRAKDVVLGDYLWATNSSGKAAAHIVTEISSSLKQGAFNPFTAQGSIVVDGVVASVHSDWFLDPLFNCLGIAHHLPAAYQVVLAPARLLYIVLGKELYIATYTALDARLNLADFGNEHGGEVVATATAGFLAALAIFLTVRNSYSRRTTQ